MAKTEAKFQTELKQSLDHIAEKYSILYHKISDMSIGQKPADCFIICNKGFFLCELKMCKTKNKINFKSLFKGREHQIEALTKGWIPKAQNYSYLIINQYKAREYNNCYYVPGNLVKELVRLDPMCISDLQGHGYLKTINQISVNYPFSERKRKLWDISKLLT